VISCVSHHQTEPLFATGGEVCQIWEETRSEPIRTFQWGVDSIHDVAYNPVETNILGKFCHYLYEYFYLNFYDKLLRKITLQSDKNYTTWIE